MKIDYAEGANGGWIIWMNSLEEKDRLLTVLKRGSNTQSPPDLEIINLIREMEWGRIMKPTIDHSCSYHCDRPECIKAQRDEMRERLKQIDAQEPVGVVGAMPGTSGFTMATFEAEKVPVGTNLYTKPEAK